MGNETNEADRSSKRPHMISYCDDKGNLTGDGVPVPEEFVPIRVTIRRDQRTYLKNHPEINVSGLLQAAIERASIENSAKDPTSVTYLLLETVQKMIDMSIDERIREMMRVHRD